MKTRTYYLRRSRGVTLMDLVIAVAVIGFLAAIAVPLMSGYMSTSRQSVIKNNIRSVSLFQTNFELVHKNYTAGTYDPADPTAADGLKATIGWEPRTEKNTVTFVVTCEKRATTDPTDLRCSRGSQNGYYFPGNDSFIFAKLTMNLIHNLQQKAGPVFE